MEAKAVEACGGLLRGEGLASQEQCTSAAEMLQRLVLDGQGTMEEVVQRNGTRACVSMLETHAAEPDAAFVTGCLMPALGVLSRCAAWPEGRTAIQEQGGLLAVFLAMDAQASLGGRETFIHACEAAIRALVSAEGVLSILERLQNYKSEQLVAGAPDYLSACAQDVSRLGLLMMCGDYAGLIAERGGVQTLVNILVAADMAPDGREKSELVRACIVAFGRAASAAVAVEGAALIVPLLVRSLRSSPDATLLRAIASLVRDPDVADALVAADAVSAILPYIGDLELVEPAFNCLAAMAAASPDGARAIVDGGGACICLPSPYRID